MNFLKYWADLRQKRYPKHSFFDILHEVSALRRADLARDFASNLRADFACAVVARYVEEARLVPSGISKQVRKSFATGSKKLRLLSSKSAGILSTVKAWLSTSQLPREIKIAELSKILSHDLLTNKPRAKPRYSHRTLQRWAERGEIPGAYCLKRGHHRVRVTADFIQWVMWMLLRDLVSEENLVQAFFCSVEVARQAFEFLDQFLNIGVAEKFETRYTIPFFQELTAQGARPPDSAFKKSIGGDPPKDLAVLMTWLEAQSPAVQIRFYLALLQAWSIMDFSHPGFVIGDRVARMAGPERNRIGYIIRVLLRENLKPTRKEICERLGMSTATFDREGYPKLLQAILACYREARVGKGGGPRRRKQHIDSSEDYSDKPQRDWSGVSKSGDDDNDDDAIEMQDSEKPDDRQNAEDDDGNED